MVAVILIDCVLPIVHAVGVRGALDEGVLAAGELPFASGPKAESPLDSRDESVE
jgi:hypothetical protein